jgi:8-oxo-dGTP pyrophosphatase MutT (NUDIX family)
MRAIRYQAAGGVVVDGADIDGARVLVLLRPGRAEIRLPKGHIEKGEKARETALREVAEESGYTDLSIRADLGAQTVEFDYRDTHVIRDERYFLIDLHSPRQIVRNAHELQFTPNWMGWDEALSKLTFQAEREWVRRAHEAWSGTPRQ